ncbi:hypothetical protein FDA94_08890 [Herbidospora galbida]|uniref:DUF3618 domain-containing protein n=1 Tax=Herbidospora galbida TaxID=2575442 RepID=A0A4U3MJ25_9ACTN|nr:hypothetical protein [Herbidospora galbida]TKK89498.1 hypothetical protein FDA94_08890 [Herbidospora galbida]
MSEYPRSGTTGHESGLGERTKGAVADTASEAKEQVRNVGGEVRAQTGQAVGQLRGRIREQAEAQSRRAAQGVRTWADDLTTMTDSGKPDSPVYGVLQQVAGTGHKAADYLENRGIGGAASDVQSFARRRPGLFLVGALAAGFVAARIAKAGAGDSPQVADDTPADVHGYRFRPAETVTTYPEPPVRPASDEPYRSTGYTTGEPR